MPEHYDVIVAGLGAHGSATLYQLAKRGKKVIGFDRFALPHNRGSSHGRTRVIRQTYAEGKEYMPIVMCAYEMWREVERESGEILMETTGAVSFAPESDPTFKFLKDVAAEYSLSQQILSRSEATKRWPMFLVPEGWAGYYDPASAALFPERCVEAHLKLAARHGAEICTNEPVVTWRASGDGVEVKTPHGTYTADRLVLTVGAWLPKLLDLKLPLRVERQVLHWFEPRHADRFKAGSCPTNSWEYTHGRAFYCQPDFGDGYKAAFHHNGADIDPDVPPSHASRQVSKTEIEVISEALSRYQPDVVGRHLGAQVCMYTNTPDLGFLVDFHPIHPQVVLGSPCSGHGFKFSSVMGEILSDLALEGRTRHDIGRFSVKRFTG